MDLTWKGCAKVFLLSVNIYLKCIVLANKDLLELGTGGVGINLKLLDV